MIGSAGHLLAHSAQTSGRLGIWAWSTAATAFIFFLFAPHAYCDTVVSGSMGSVQLEARDSSVAEVLSALSQALPIRYRTSVELNRAVTGTFKGPALKVISRVLQDYDYVIRQNAEGGFEVMVIKLAGGDSSKVVSIGWRALHPSTEVNTGNPAVKGGPYPHPQWRARSYSRTMQPKTTR